MLGILFCFLLVLPLSNSKLNCSQCSDEFIVYRDCTETIRENASVNELMVSLKPLSGYFGIKIVIENSGSEILTDVRWTFSTTAGMVLVGGTGEGIIDQIEQNSETIISLYPTPGKTSSSPIGLGTIEMEATAQASTTTIQRTTAEAFSLLCFTFFSTDEGNTAEYTVTFDATWSQETHPFDFPPNPHFSGLIGASHNDEITFWGEGQLASLGIKSMAETGSKDPLNNEIDTAIASGVAFKKLSGGGINPSPGSISLTFKISDEYPLVSLVSMIAPSPDWFIGVDSLSLFENGDFLDEKTIVLYAYDAGTDSGTTYTSPDEPTDPPEAIYKIETNPFVYDDALIPLGTFTFSRV